ncbi:migration and invasion inhibitory protein [Stigmatopora nigra]
MKRKCKEKHVTITSDIFDQHLHTPSPTPSTSWASETSEKSTASPRKNGSSETFTTKSCPAPQTKRQNKQQNRAEVTFQKDRIPEESALDGSPRLRPLLGYDWIAGVLDVEKTLNERSEDFYKELQDFRAQNKKECIHQPRDKSSLEEPPLLTLLADTDCLGEDKDAHQCTFLYTVNSRLFPVPVHSQERCPVCRRPKSAHPHTRDKPALVRVSIPRATVLPPYEYKAHRRKSFDPADSLGLPSHCLLGWANNVRSGYDPPSNLDLRSHLEKRTETSQEQVTRSPHPGQVPIVTPMARHQFQHFTPKRKKKRPLMKR